MPVSNKGLHSICEPVWGSVSSVVTQPVSRVGDLRVSRVRVQSVSRVGAQCEEGWDSLRAGPGLSG